MPDMTPVGNTIIPPNPMTGINQLSGLVGIKSGLLGIQQQKQQLQLQAQELQRSQLETQQAQGTNQFFSSVDMNQLHGPDGTLDIDAVHARPEYQQLPGVARVKVDSIVNTLKGQQIDNKSKLMTYTGEQVGALGQAAEAAAKAPDPETRKAIMDNAVKTNPQLAQPMSVYQPWLDKSGYSPGILKHMANVSVDVNANRPKPGVIETPTNVLPTTVEPSTAIQTPTGQNFPKNLPATVVTPPGGVPEVWGGPKGAGGGATAKGQFAAGPRPTDQDLARHNAYETGLNNRVASATDLLPRLQLINAAADNIRTGGGTSARADIAQKLQAMNAPKALVDAVSGGDLGQVQSTEKLLFQTTFAGLRQSMQGDPARQAEWEAANKVFANVDTDPRARKEILGFMADQGQRDYAEQTALNTAKMKGTFNPATWQSEIQQKIRAGQVPGLPPSQIPSTKSQTPQTKTIKRTGTLNGRKVAEYSDGTHGYID